MSALKRFIPLLDRVLVEKVAPMAQTAGGILLPDSAVSKVSCACRSGVKERERGWVGRRECCRELIYP